MDADYTEQKGAVLPAPSPRHRDLEIDGEGEERTLLVNTDGCAGGFVYLESEGGDTSWAIEEGPDVDSPEKAFDEIDSGTVTSGNDDHRPVSSMSGGAVLIRVTPENGASLRLIVKFH